MEEAREGEKAQEMRREKRVQEAREEEAKAAQGKQEGEERVDAQGGCRRKEGEMKDENSLHEESHVSDRHMTWWRNAWWIRMDSGPHLRTARDRRRAWRAATRAAREARETRKASGREREKWETGGKESNANILNLVFHFPNASTPAAAATVRLQ